MGLHFKTTITAEYDLSSFLISVTIKEALESTDVDKVRLGHMTAKGKVTTSVNISSHTLRKEDDQYKLMKIDKWKVT